MLKNLYLLRISTIAILECILLCYIPFTFAQEPYIKTPEELLQEVIAASKQPEPLKETPVPVTVITSEMIENIGAKNLKDILITYVPGMAFSQDHNEINVAMRGIYASSQQKILILLDGHRLNSRSYSEANPDYSISLEKIKQIEVLRGPASSLYGNVALTAVINIVTKEGKDLDGASIKIGAGNFGQRKFSIVYGKDLKNENDFLFWGTYYKADGEKIDISAKDDYSASPKDGHAIVEGIKDMPSYDIGFKYKYDSFSFLGNLRYCKYIEPFTAGGNTGEVYDYDKYRTFLGTGPGLASRFGHLGIKYNNKITDDLKFQIHGYADYFDIQPNLIISPDSTEKFGVPNWNDYDLGFITQFDYDYDLKNIGKGNLIVGTQIDGMEVYDSSFPLGLGGELTMMADSRGMPLLEKGKETIYSVFAQTKQRIKHVIILNIGLRYDNKDRHKGKNVDKFSPRLAFIYLPSKMFDIKFSYSTSFVDAPYWYRYNSLASYKGAEDLKPEYLKSLQITPTIKSRNGRLQIGLNFFHNDLTDFIFRDDTRDPERFYFNAGYLKSWGVENVTSYIAKSYKIRSNFAYQKAYKSEDYGVTDGKIHNIPNWTANLILDFNPFYSIYKKLWLDVTTRYIGEQLSPINVPLEDKKDLDHKVDPAFITNIGLRLNDIFNKFSIDVRGYNIFNERYYQGGSVLHPYPQPGRWYMVNFAFDLK